MVLADLCNRRLKESCQWIFNNSEYRRWLLGSFKTLYCVGPRKILSTSMLADNLGSNGVY
jgi:hypothetical protein